MIISTTTTIERRSVCQCLGVVTGEVIFGADIFNDLFAGVGDIIDGRASFY